MEPVGGGAVFLETVGPRLRLAEGRAGMADPPSEGRAPQDVINAAMSTSGIPYFPALVRFIVLP